LVIISRGCEKGAKNSYRSYPTEFVFEVKNENSSLTNCFCDPKGEVSNLKASFKNRTEKFCILTAMKTRQTAGGFFFFVKSFF
jgi:hypothetical protein